ncbi:MAG: response regulator transcription factor [Phycisphaerae bacterium]|nr:response regulator transcription factor [Phycisphaerae bacterium]NUQ46190.1 response regulator transcription factor [Phycisphaerae bacterium]
MNRIRILLADDHALVRAGIRSLLSDLAGMEVVAEAADGREALQLIERHRPDVVLMDIMMPGLNGLDAAARVAAHHPDTRVIILSMNATEEYVYQALRAGASGYVLKDARPAELEEAVRAVVRGDAYLSSAVSRHVVAAFRQKPNGAARSLDQLTPRQREVLQLIAEGASNKQIAQKLGISVKTAEGHRAQLMQTLNIHDVAGLVRYAIRMGLVSADD